MNFTSDNTAPIHPKVLEALTDVNDGHRRSYGIEGEMDAVTALVRDVFEAPEAAVYLVATGTAANSLLLASLVQPWQTVFCTPVAHIHEDECNAPEFYSGAKLTLVPGLENGKMTVSSLKAALDNEETRGVHGPQRGAVSITQTTEKGTVYHLDEVKKIGDLSKSYQLPVHLDGARFANAVSHLSCTPAQTTWRSGVDAVSFGGTKNGLMGVEACVLFDPKTAWEFELRRKRGGHLFSKHRYLSAQMLTYLEDGLWLDLAAVANERCALLAAGLARFEQVHLEFSPEANIIFARFPRYIHQELHRQGASYFVNGGPLDVGDKDEILGARLVTNWSTSQGEVEEFLSTLQSAC